MQDFILFMQRHLLLTLGLIIIAFLLTILEFIKIKRKTSQLSPQQAVQLINHENAIVVDIRTLEGYNSGHIVDAVSLPFSELNDKIKKLEKSKTQPIIVVCEMGKESIQAVTLLGQKGFARVYSLEGGLRAWKLADLPLVKG